MTVNDINVTVITMMQSMFQPTAGANNNEFRFVSADDQASFYGLCSC